MFPSLLQKCKISSLNARQIFTTSSYLMAKKESRINVERHNFGVINDKDISFFESIIGSKHMLTNDLDKYNEDFLHCINGSSKLVLKPQTPQEISAILKYCNERKLALCPQGGNTGLVGGSVPIFDEIVLSMERLNKVLNIDPITGIVVSEAGCILENLDGAVREKGLIIPLDLGAKSSCHIGGNVATNAGGLRVVRYGSLHGSVLGVEAVLANGKIMDLLSNFKKDNTGYHLKHMFIGSEGTLGVITKVSILCPPIPESVHLAFIGLSSFENVLTTFRNAKRYLGEILSSVEFIDADSLNASVTNFNLKSPIEGYPFYMLLETSGSNASHDMEKFQKFLERGMENEEILDGTITNEVSKMQNIWKLRELIAVAMVKEGYCFKYDISLPLNDFYNIVGVMQKRVGSMATRVCGYGHLGDCNLHLNISCPEYTDEIYKAIEPYVFEYTSKVKGSISAEHGIGFLKTKYLSYSKSAEAIAMMKSMKQLMDPNGILNPYKVLN